MEKKRSCVRARFATVLLGVVIMLFFAGQCGWAVFYDSGEVVDIDYAIYNDFLEVGNATVNMYTGAYVDWGIYAYPGSTVNIHGGEIGEFMAISVSDGASVTVYGTGFAVDNNPVSAGELMLPGDMGTLTGTYADGSDINLLIFSDVAILLVDTAAGGPESIDIDIKPGSAPNAINLGSNGVIPVAILSSQTLDATSLPAENVFLAGANVAVRGKGNKYLASQEDVNGDGLVDLVIKVETENLDPGTFQDGTAVLRVHETSDQSSAVLYEGSDGITIVPPE
jgi:hypothetical protein